MHEKFSIYRQLGHTAKIKHANISYAKKKKKATRKFPGLLYLRIRKQEHVLCMYKRGRGRWFEEGVFLVQSQIADSTSKQYLQ